MSHHPSSAELASFRRDLMPSWFDNPYPHRPDAWPDEREQGTGATATANLFFRSRDADAFWFARREASAMRSRAYPTVNHAPGDAAWQNERRYGAPDHWWQHGYGFPADFF